jgi:hypothetical protein
MTIYKMAVGIMTADIMTVGKMTRLNDSDIMTIDKMIPCKISVDIMTVDIMTVD